MPCTRTEALRAGGEERGVERHTHRTRTPTRHTHLGSFRTLSTDTPRYHAGLYLAATTPASSACLNAWRRRLQAAPAGSRDQPLLTAAAEKGECSLHVLNGAHFSFLDPWRCGDIAYASTTVNHFTRTGRLRGKPKLSMCGVGTSARQLFSFDGFLLSGTTTSAPAAFSARGRASALRA